MPTASPSPRPGRFSAVTPRPAAIDSSSGKFGKAACASATNRPIGSRVGSCATAAATDDKWTTAARARIRRAIIACEYLSADSTIGSVVNVHQLAREREALVERRHPPVELLFIDVPQDASDLRSRPQPEREQVPSHDNRIGRTVLDAEAPRALEEDVNGGT